LWRRAINNLKIIPAVSGIMIARVFEGLRNLVVETQCSRFSEVLVSENVLAKKLFFEGLYSFIQDILSGLQKLFPIISLIVIFPSPFSERGVH
jgi:hypothetical protein